MSPQIVAILVAVFVCIDAIIVLAVFNMAANELKSLAADFPAREPQIHAERRNFQSFGLGLMNLGWSFHVTSDPQYVHLFPALLFRKLGVPNFSIPRTELKDPKKCLGGVRVSLKGHDLRGPRWCLAPEVR